MTPQFLDTAIRWASGRGGRMWDVPVGAAGWVALRRGALEPVVSEARSRSDLPAHIRFQMVKWAKDVTTGVPLMSSFRPGQQIQGSAARSAAAGALRTRLAGENSRGVAEQLVAIDDSLNGAEMLDLAREDLEAEIALAAAQPKRGTGVNPKVLTTIVGDVVDRLESVGIRPFLMSGTLLGFMREGSFLEHDHDVDLGLLPGDAILDAEAALTDAGLELSIPVPDEWLVAVHESGLHIDLFRHDLRDGLFWHQTKIHQWWNTPFGIDELEIGGRSWWVPDDAHRYLDENYGEWAAPVAFYDMGFDTPNRCYVDDVAAIEHLYLACTRALRDGDRWTVEAAARELRDSFGVDVTRNLAPSPLLRSASTGQPL